MQTIATLILYYFIWVLFLIMNSKILKKSVSNTVDVAVINALHLN